MEEINEVEIRKIKEKKLVLWKVNKIDRPLARLTKRKREDLNYYNQESKRGHYYPYYRNKNRIIRK